eukprot:248204_1
MNDFQHKIDLKFEEYNKETNGLLYWIGTNGKTESYSNPLETKQIDVRSSALKDPCKKSSVIGLQGPIQYCISVAIQEDESVFFLIDLKDNWIKPTHYAWRNYVYGHMYWNRKWNLEGSHNSGKDWIVIDKQNNNDQLKGKGKIVAFKIDHNINNTAFNQFRVSSVKLSDGYSQFACSGFEFYGILFQNKKMEEHKSTNSMDVINDNINAINVQLKSIMHQQQNQIKLNEENKLMKNRMDNISLSIKTIQTQINKLNETHNDD